MIRKAILALAATALICSYGQAQEAKEWSLMNCIEYAHENNISIKRQGLNEKYRQNELKQAKLNLLPDLNVESGFRSSYGLEWNQAAERNFDERTNSFNSGIVSRATLFEGLSKQNNIKKEKYNLLAAEQDIAKVKNDITLQITSLYLQILFDKELLKVAQEQYETSKLQAERTKKLVDAGSQAMGSYLEIKSQAAKEALNVTQQENNLGLSLLNLAQLLDLESPIDFDIQTPTLPALDNFENKQPHRIYETALGIMPQIISSEYQVTSKEYELKQVKGNYYPKLYISGGWNSMAYFYEDINNPSLISQFKDNRRYYYSLNLSIPIFNRLQTRNNVKNTQISLSDTRYQLENEKLKLRKEIQQAYADALAAYKKYLSGQDAVNSYKESFRYTEKKFNVGLVNSVDYNVAKTDYTRAQSDLLQAKYEYILRTKILDFYKGIPLEL